MGSESGPVTRPRVMSVWARSRAGLGRPERAGRKRGGVAKKTQMLGSRPSSIIRPENWGGTGVGNAPDETTAGAKGSVRPRLQARLTDGKLGMKNYASNVDSPRDLVMLALRVLATAVARLRDRAADLLCPPGAERRGSLYPGCKLCEGWVKASGDLRSGRAVRGLV
jgi:hypothetical protein